MFTETEWRLLTALEGTTDMDWLKFHLNLVNITANSEFDNVVVSGWNVGQADVDFLFTQVDGEIICNVQTFDEERAEVLHFASQDTAAIAAEFKGLMARFPAEVGQLLEDGTAADVSYHHDACPSIGVLDAEGEVVLRMWVAEAIPALREYPDGPRFQVCGFDAVETDDVAEAVKAFRAQAIAARQV